MVAYGPGIIAGPQPMPRVDDVDLAPTMTALLGIPTPRHSRGQPLVAWLDVSDDARATMACTEVQDLARTLGESDDDGAASRLHASPTREPDRIASALPIARALDTRTSEAETAVAATGLHGSHSSRRRSPRCSHSSSSSARCPEAARRRWHRVRRRTRRERVRDRLSREAARRMAHARRASRSTCSSMRRCSCGSSYRSRRAASSSVRRCSRRSLFPGVLVLTETHSALTEAYLLSAVLVGFALTRGIPTSKGFPWAWTSPAPSRMALYGPPLLAVSVVCIDAGNFSPAWLLAAPRLQLAIALTCLVTFAAFRHVRLKPALWGPSPARPSPRSRSTSAGARRRGSASWDGASSRRSPRLRSIGGSAPTQSCSPSAPTRGYHATSRCRCSSRATWSPWGSVTPSQSTSPSRTNGSRVAGVVPDPHTQHRVFRLRLGLRPARRDPAWRFTSCTSTLRPERFAIPASRCPASCSRWCTNMRWPGAFSCSEHSFPFPAPCASLRSGASLRSTLFARRCSSGRSKPPAGPSGRRYG